MKIIGEINQKPKNFRFLAWGVMFMLFFVLMSFFIAVWGFGNLDTNSTVSFQKIIPRDLDVSLSLFSLLGSFEVTASILALVSLVFWRKTKLFPFSFVLFGAVLVLELVGKNYIYHPGPPHYYFRYSLPFELPTAYVHTSYSFPSGHVSRTAFLSVVAMFVCYTITKRKSFRLATGLIISSILIVMFISRVYLGEHWLTDVVGGLFLGISLGLLSLVYY